jgi:hypothetical protein
MPARLTEDLDRLLCFLLIANKLADANKAMCKSQSFDYLPDGEQECQPLVSNFSSSEDPRLHCTTLHHSPECSQVHHLTHSTCGLRLCLSRQCPALVCLLCRALQVLVRQTCSYIETVAREKPCQALAFRATSLRTAHAAM